ncbi:DUF6507 family protein [Streptomyces flavofungini]|uniref:DUF6507 family protein n=1 Tax=Streptomyces flavofungini TaxID=68200 RepID=UPI0025B1CDE0|nr:DUF6507 family protein [Streptomyces flavofungini]WJV46471.1 DUF6507 family protein [Streptomyces flavofungini]
MPAWDITPSGVDSVASLVGLAMDDMAKDVKAYGEDMKSAAASAGTIGAGYCGASAPPGAVGIALAVFMDGKMGDVLSLGARSANAVNGAIDATNHYIDGDLRKAATAQRNAGKAPDVEKLLADARKKSDPGEK